MSYFRDLELCRYHSGPFDSSNWNCPLLSIGWLERTEDYVQENFDHREIVKTISLLRNGFKRDFSGYNFRGLHACSLCKNDEDLLLINSYVNLFIPSESCVFVAPGAIDHYITEHMYKPPEEFLNALLRCPNPASSEYDDTLEKSNGGQSPPFQRNNW